MGIGKELNSIADHPKIDVDEKELQRIREDYRIYKGDYKPVSYLNSYGRQKQRPFMYLNMLKSVSELMSNLVFNEQCEINVGVKDGDTADEKPSDAQIFIDEVFNQNDFKKNLARYLEPMFATGGLAVRPYIDTSDYSVKFSWIQADSFYPLKSNTNNISECAIPTYSKEVRGDKTFYYTLLEFHEWENGRYKITNELYQSESIDKVGVKVALNTLEQYAELQETSYMENLSRPQFAYTKPNGFNNISPMSPLGLGICDNCLTTLAQINDTYDQFNWEIKMGQRKVIASDHFLKTAPDEQNKGIKQVFDDESNVFVGLQGDMDKMTLQDITHDIRTEQYTAAINQFFKTLEMQTKLSVGTFSFDGQSVKTATEVVSENSQTYRTRNAHIVEIEKFIKELVISVCELAKATTNANGQVVYTGEIPSYDEIGIDFDDGIFTDKNDQLEYYGKAKTLGLIPDVEAIGRVFDLPSEKAQEWVEQIAQQKASEVSAIRSDNLLDEWEKKNFPPE